MTVIDKRCQACGEPLMEISANRDYFMHLCDNQGCPMWRQPQGYMGKNPDPTYHGLYAGRQIRVR